jgi:hypothetical protein
VFYTKADSEAKTCTGISNVYGLGQCINGNYNWNTLPWVFFFLLRRRDESTFVALIWIFVIFSKKRDPDSLEPEGSDQSQSITPKRLRAGVNWHNFSTVNEAYEARYLCLGEHSLARSFFRVLGKFRLS